MNPETIAQIVKLSLELALEIVRSIPKEQHARFWERHERNMQFWEDVFKKLSPTPAKEEKPSE